MRIHYLQHVPFEGLGFIEQWAQAEGHDVTATRLFAGEHVPAGEEIELLIVLGGPMGVHDEQVHGWLVEEKEFIRREIKRGQIVLGICLGAQLIADVLGADVYPASEKEIGWFPIERVTTEDDSPILPVFPDRLDVLHWHGDTFDLPPHAVRLAQSAVCRNQGFVYADRVIALQFHLESTHASLSELISNCEHELVTSTYVQSREEMLSDAGRFEATHQVMAGLLARLAAMRQNA